MTLALQKKFAQYHADNPHIWNEFERLAIQMAKTRPYFSARTIIHKMRWDSAIRDNGEKFKISNNFTPYYARMFELKYPQHKDFFRKRPV